MAGFDIALQRLRNQCLSSPGFQHPGDIVQWMGAVQAQDYYAAKWALGLRLHDATDNDIENAFTRGEILRTHIMRPTWHFVTPSDIRWLLKLTAPRVNAANSHYYRKLELDDAVFRRCHKALTRALQGGRHLPRATLRSVINRTRVNCDDLMRFTFILIRAELDGLICSGPRSGKQFTYALLEERVPQTKPLTRDEALAELTHRYFTSHGPATPSDFMWWSGLAANDVKHGLELAKSQLVKEEIDRTTYWLSPSTSIAPRPSRAAYLLPCFDEYLVAYKDRSAATGGQSLADNVVLDSTIVWKGRILGSWKRKIEKNIVSVDLKPFAPLSQTERSAVTAALQRYSRFLSMTVIVK